MTTVEFEPAALPNRPSSRELLADRVRAVGRAWHDPDERLYELRRLNVEVLLLARMVEAPARPEPEPEPEPDPPPPPTPPTRYRSRPGPKIRCHPTTRCPRCGREIAVGRLVSHQRGRNCR